jgi:predicted small secreted protein
MKIFIALVLSSTLAACSTVSGLGKDISSVADYTKDKMSGK